MPGGPPQSLSAAFSPRAAWPWWKAVARRDWTDKDGNKRVAAEVVADNVYFGDSKRDGDAPSYGGSYGSAPGYGAPADSGYGAPPQGGYGTPSVGASEFAEIDDVDGELPF